MANTFSEKIIKKYDYGDKNLKNYEKILENYKNQIECRGVYCSDFSEFKKTISFFVETSSQKDLFYKELIHDIKSPILSIELAIRNCEGNYPIKDIYNINSSILELINGTLALHSKRDKKEDLRAFNLIQNILEMHKFLIKEKELDFEVKIDKKFKIKGHKNYLDRVFSNLIYNAIKYSPEKSKVKIYQNGKNILCFQNKLSDGISKKGYGLGLKIVEKLCEKSGIKFYKRKILDKITFCLKFQNMS